MTILDRLYKDHQYPTTISYCNGCIACVKKTCTECKQKSVSIREINVQTSYETTNVGFQTIKCYQLIDARDNTNLQYCSILAEYIKIVSEYDQIIPQSQTADKPTARRGTHTQQLRDTKRTN